MFTPELNRSLTPHKRVYGSGSGSNARDGPMGKGKVVAFLDENDDRSLAEKVSSLENELFDYQYNMGLLLIEKKKWTSKYEELKLALDETEDALKREKTDHLLAISEVEKREEKLRNALGVEKLCVLDLDKALQATRSEHAEIKFIADSKLAEAHTLIASIEEKSLEVEAKLRAAEAKLAEMSRKNSEIERKSQEVESREYAIRKERFSLITDREALEFDLSKRNEDLRKWELKLQEDAERLAEGERIINQREQRANEYDKIIKQKQKDLEEIEMKIDAAKLDLKEKKDDIDQTVSNLIFKEQESDALRKKVENKERQLLEVEEKLNEREQVGIQTLLDEHVTALDEKKHEFELEIDKKWESLDAEFKSKVIDVKKKEAALNHMEKKVCKREQALDKRMEKLKEKEEEFELKMEVLKEMEEAIKSGGENLGTEKQQLLADREYLLSLKAEVEKIRAENAEQILKIQEEKDQLRITEEERSEYFHLQTELKKEIENCRCQEELVLKEAEDLKVQKENFEKEWELLDEKRIMIEKEEKNLIEQKVNLEKQKLSEEESLRNEKHLMESNIKEELEALDAAKAAFKATMEHQQLVVSETTESERSQMIHDLEQQRQELEMNIEKSREEMEMKYEESKKLFQEEKEREVENINYLKEVARREMEEMKQERLKIDKERQEVDSSKRYLQGKQTEIRKDIDDLVYLSKKLKEQREKLINKKNCFIAVVEKQKRCKNCGETISGYEPADLQSLQEIENPDILPLTRLADNYTKDLALGASERQNIEMPADGLGSKFATSGGTMSWLRKYTSKIFKFSHSHAKRLKLDAGQSPEREELLAAEQATMGLALQRLGSTVNENEISFAIANEPHHAHRVQSDANVRYAGHLAIDEQSIINSAAREDHPSPDRNHGQVVRMRGRPRVNRTRSMKDVVKDAKVLLGEASELNMMEPSNVKAETSDHGNAESPAESNLGGKGTSINSLKRRQAQASQATASEHEGGDSELLSDIVGSDQKKKQKVAPVVQTAGKKPVEKRYNLRRAKAGIRAAKAFSDLNSENRVVRHEEDVYGGAGSETQNLEADTRGNHAQNVDLVDGVNGTPQANDASVDGGEYRNQSGDEGALGLEDDDEEGDDDDDDDDEDWQL